MDGQADSDTSPKTLFAGSINIDGWLQSQVYTIFFAI